MRAWREGSVGRGQDWVHANWTVRADAQRVSRNSEPQVAYPELPWHSYLNSNVKVLAVAHVVAGCWSLLRPNLQTAVYSQNV
jgi:hypothetical protein